MNPIFKWVGSKRQIVQEVEKIAPKTKKYFEPFVGGGSLFFHLCDKRTYSYTCINDINDKLITTYKIIRDKPNDLINELEKIKENYNGKDYINQKNFYYQKRKEFNSSKNDLEIASKFIFLNKTCFGGLYRTNKDGDFNTAFLGCEAININYDNIFQASKLLENTKILCNNYKNIEHYIDKDSFVFLDPPYYKSFNEYYNKGFSGNNLRDLFGFCYNVDKVGGYFVLCNVQDDKVKEMFEQNFNIKTIEIDRYFRGKKKIKEYLIYNYEEK